MMYVLWQWPRLHSPQQYLTDANAKSRTGVDINLVAGKAVQAADDSDDDRIRQVTSFDRIHAQVEKNGIGQQKKHASGSDGLISQMWNQQRIISSKLNVGAAQVSSELRKGEKGERKGERRGERNGIEWNTGTKRG
eukprot:scaffold428_cov147-Chaetoceros_neogracile.AAC.1